MQKRLSKKRIIYLMLSTYIISLSSFQLGFGFDAWFARLSFILFVLSLIFAKKIILTIQAKWYLLFWVFYFMSIFWAKNPNDTLYYINNIIQIIGILLILPSILEDKKDIDAALKIIVLSMTITSIIVFFRSPNILSNIERLGDVVGLHPNTLGMRLAISNVILLYFIRDAKKTPSRSNIKKIVYILLFIIFSILLVFTGSKKGLFVLIFGFLFFKIIHQKGLVSLIKITVSIVIITLAVYLIYSNEVTYQIMGKRVEYMFNTITGNTTTHRIDTSLLERQFYAGQATKLFIRNPFFGYGGNNFVTYMNEISYSHVAYSHNNYLELLSTLGITGFTLFYSIWIITLFQVFKIYAIRKDYKTAIFMTLILILLITDTGNVSYVSEFNVIIFSLVSAYLVIVERNSPKLTVGKTNDF